jgi:hypothetical protein
MRVIVITMVRFFDKLKRSLRKSNPSPPPVDTPSTSQPAPDAENPSVSDQPSTPLATASPAVISDPSDSPTLPETTPQPSASPVATKQTSGVKIRRIRRIPRHGNRPRPVIRERDNEDSEDAAKPASRIEPLPVHEDTKDSETGLPDQEPVAAQDDSAQPATSSKHVITRKPSAQKRQRRIRVVRPKVRVVR